MSPLQILLLAVSLSMDAFAVAVGTGASGKAVGGRARFRIAFHFGLFQFIMPVLGWCIAGTVSILLIHYDAWIAFGLLAIVGGQMVWSGVRGAEYQEFHNDPTRGFSLVALSVATSIDALAVGVSIGLLGERILWPSAVIGAVAGTFSLVGMRLGGRMGRRFGPSMQIVSGMILFGIGLSLLVGRMR